MSVYRKPEEKSCGRLQRFSGSVDLALLSWHFTALMKQIFFQGLISASSKAEAVRILEALTRKKLVPGGRITSGESLYWWKGKRVKKIYWNLSIFLVSANRRKIISIARKLQKDETPIVIFFKIDSGNSDFFEWLARNSA
jgi:uncharacterized protein involved in tolerance to divalent cations